MKSTWSLILALFTVSTLSHPISTPESSKKEPTLEELWGQDQPFSGINTFAHLPHTKCLIDPDLKFDIGIIGLPFDTAVTYRPGARFGPRAIRTASQRQTPLTGYNFRAEINPYTGWANVIDCGDIPISPMNNQVALKQMSAGYDNLLNHNATNQEYNDIPRLISLGGDHAIILPALRALHKKYGEITLIHFDSHLDTWKPERFSGSWDSDKDEFTHGSMLWMAWKEGLLSKDKNFHVGLRTRLNSLEDYKDDDQQGFTRILADEIFTLGVDGIVDQILRTIPENNPVYISFDIDCIDPGQAPGTGTPEVGGLFTREIIQMLRKLENLNLVGADIVEVSPEYDSGEVTSLAAVQVVYEIITSMVKKGPLQLKNIEKDFKPAEAVQNSLLNQANSVVQNILRNTW